MVAWFYEKKLKQIFFSNIHTNKNQATTRPIILSTKKGKLDGRSILWEKINFICLWALVVKRIYQTCHSLFLKRGEPSDYLILWKEIEIIIFSTLVVKKNQVTPLLSYPWGTNNWSNGKKMEIIFSTTKKKKKNPWERKIG